MKVEQDFKIGQILVRQEISDVNQKSRRHSKYSIRSILKVFFFPSSIRKTYLLNPCFLICPCYNILAPLKIYGIP